MRAVLDSCPGSEAGAPIRRFGIAPDASLDRTADYLAKITSEITSPSTKEGRDGNRAPFAILRDALATGLAEDCELWLTWEKVSHNRRQLTWSLTPARVGRAARRAHRRGDCPAGHARRRPACICG